MNVGASGEIGAMEVASLGGSEWFGCDAGVCMGFAAVGRSMLLQGPSPALGPLECATECGLERPRSGIPWKFSLGNDAFT